MICVSVLVVVTADRACCERIERLTAIEVFDAHTGNLLVAGVRQ